MDTRRRILAGIAMLFGGAAIVPAKTQATCCNAKQIKRTVQIHGTSDLPVTICVECGTVRATKEWVAQIVSETPGL